MCLYKQVLYQKHPTNTAFHVWMKWLNGEYYIHQKMAVFTFIDFESF